MIHRDSDCGNVQAQRKADQRYCRIRIKTIAEELQNFKDKKYPFAANPERNDMWLEIDFNDQDFEMAVLEYIAGILGQYYSPFRLIKPQVHC
jgi:hypothetical protein